MSSKSKFLEKIYTNTKDTGSFGGVKRLLDSARITHNRKDINEADVKKFLQGQNTYTLHKQIRRKFRRNPVIVKGIDVQWQADLADVIELSRENNGYHYILTVIDCFSKYAWAIPVKRKDSANMVEAFTCLFHLSAPRKPKRLQTDKGKEFVNSPVQQYLKQEGIEHFVTNNETKASLVERFNRTLKSRMFAYFTEMKTRKYIDILQNLVDSYNKSEHRSIGMKPCDVKIKDEPKIWHRLYGKVAERVVPDQKTKKLSPKKGSTVRISKAKTSFDKGYLPNWTKELFKVTKVRSQYPKNLYKLKDYTDEEIQGSFYPEEIEKVKDSKIYDIERVLKTRKLPNGKKELFVKWQDWPAKFNSWISESYLAKQ